MRNMRIVFLPTLIVIYKLKPMGRDYSHFHQFMRGNDGMPIGDFAYLLDVKPNAPEVHKMLLEQRFVDPDDILFISPMTGIPCAQNLPEIEAWLDKLHKAASESPLCQYQ